MVAQRNKEVEEQRRRAVPHLELHRAAALKGAAAADDEREVVGAQLRVRVGCVGVGVARRREDGAALDAGLCRALETTIFDLHAKVIKKGLLTKALLP